MILLLMGNALAQTTYNLPNASVAVDGSTYSVGLGLAALRAGPLPSLRTTASFDASDFGVLMTSTIYQGTQMEGFDVLSMRYMVLNTDRIRLAPTIMLSDHWGVSSMDYRLTSRVGLALETGRDQWLWDMSASVIGWQYRPQYNGQILSRMTVLDTVLALEMGLRYEFKEGHFCRLGLLGPLPSFRYAVPTTVGTIELTGATLGTQHLLQLDVRR